jgi:ribosomal protein S27AE
MATCIRCGGEMSPGALFSAVRTSFRPQESKFLTLETGDVMTKAAMCRQCGVVEIIGDVNKLRRLTSDPEPSTEPFVRGTDG